MTIKDEVATFRKEPGVTSRFEGGKEILTKKGQFINFVSDRLGGRRPTTPKVFDQRQFVIEDGKITRIVRDTRVTQQDRSIQTFSPFISSRRTFKDGRLVEDISRSDRGIGRALEVTVQKPSGVFETTARPEAPREGGQVVGTTPTGEKIFRGARQFLDGQVVAQQAGFRVEGISGRFGTLEEARTAIPRTQVREVPTALRAGPPGMERERFFVTPKGSAIRRFTGEAPPVGSREITQERFRTIRETGVTTAREEARTRRAQEFGLGVGLTLFQKQREARERKALRARIEDVGLRQAVGEEILKPFPVQKLRQERLLAEREFVSKVAGISEKRLKGLELKGRRIPGAPLIEITGEKFKPQKLKIEEVRAIQFEEQRRVSPETKAIKEQELIAKRASKKGLLGFPQIAKAEVVAGVASTAFFVRKRPVETALTLGGFGLAGAAFPVAVGVGVTGLIGLDIARKVKAGKPLPQAILREAGEVLPFVAGVGIGAGAIRAARRGIRFRAKGRPTEITRLKGVDLAKAFERRGKITTKETALILDVTTKQFKRRKDIPKPAKPGTKIPLELRGGRLAKISPTALESRIIKSFGLAEIGKRGRVTTRLVGFPEVEVGKTFVSPKPVDIKPFRTLPGQKFTTERFVERKGFERVRIQDTLLAQRRDIGITESGLFIAGLKGKPKVDLFPFVSERISAVRPTRVRLKALTEVKIVEPFKPPKPSEIIVAERLFGKPVKKAKLPKELRMELFPRVKKRKKLPVLVAEPTTAAVLGFQELIAAQRIIKPRGISDVLRVRKAPLLRVSDFAIKPVAIPDTRQITIPKLGQIPKAEIAPIISVKPITKEEQMLRFKPITKLKLPTKLVIDVKPITGIEAKVGLIALPAVVSGVDVIQKPIFDFPRPPPEPRLEPLRPPKFPPFLPILPPLFPPGLLRELKAKIPKRPRRVKTPTLFDIEFGDLVLPKKFVPGPIFTGIEIFRFAKRKKKKGKKKKR